MRKVMQTVRGLLRGQRGITGLETAIVLIAFVVVSSTFAFAALSTGLFSADKSKETISAGLSEAAGTMEMRGEVVLKEGTDANTTDTLTFLVTNSVGQGVVNLDPGTTIIQYKDPGQAYLFAGSTYFTVSNEVSGGDGDNLLEPGEVYSITVDIEAAKDAGAMSADLGPDTTFSLEVIPPQGAPLLIQRTTPPADWDNYIVLN